VWLAQSFGSPKWLKEYIFLGPACRFRPLLSFFYTAP